MSVTSLDSTATQTDAGGQFASLVGRIVAIIGADHFPTGERAALKRLPPNEPPGLAFYRFWPRYVRAETPSDTQALDWALALSGIALMGSNAHRPGRRLGAALAQTGYSEMRIERLLGTDDAAMRRVLFMRALRYLAAKGEPIDWVEAARWLLSAQEQREARSRRIARDYFATQSRLENQEGE